VWLCFIDPRVSKIRNGSSSCVGLFSRTLRFQVWRVASGGALAPEPAVRQRGRTRVSTDCNSLFPRFPCFFCHRTSSAVFFFEIRHSYPELSDLNFWSGGRPISKKTGKQRVQTRKTRKKTLYDLKKHKEKLSDCKINLGKPESCEIWNQN